MRSGPLQGRVFSDFLLDHGGNGDPVLLYIGQRLFLKSGERFQEPPGIIFTVL